MRKAYATSVDQQCRIARSLGLSDRVLNKLNRNSFGYSALSLDEPSTSRGFTAFEAVKVSRGGISGVVPDLHVFGSRLDFEPGGYDTDEEKPLAPPAKSGRRPEPSPPRRSSDLLSGLLEKQSMLLSRKSELKRDASGKVVIVNESLAPTVKSAATSSLTSSSSSLQSNRRTSIDSSSAKKCSSTSGSISNARPNVAKEGVDMHYKPSRVSRVDERSFANYDSTIEAVLHKVMTTPIDRSHETITSSTGLNGSRTSVSSRCLERLRDIADAAIAATTIKEEVPDTTFENNNHHADAFTHVKQEPFTPTLTVKKELVDGFEPIKIKVEARSGLEQLRRTVVVGGDSRTGEEFTTHTDSMPSYVDAKHNVDRKRVVKSTQGWINSLKLTIPTVINSLNAFTDLETLGPSPSNLMKSVKVEPVFDLSRVKKEPLDCEDFTSLPSGTLQETAKPPPIDLGVSLARESRNSEKGKVKAMSCRKIYSRNGVRHFSCFQFRPETKSQTIGLVRIEGHHPTREVEGQDCRTINGITIITGYLEIGGDPGAVAQIDEVDQQVRKSKQNHEVRRGSGVPRGKRVLHENRCESSENEGLLKR